MLHAEVRGLGTRVVLLHGFTQNSRCWGDFGEFVAQHHETVLVDLPGHGESRHDEASLQESAALVGEVGGCGTYVGYSLGGRIALHVALQNPELVERMVLIGATAGLRTPEERAERVAADDALAQGIETNGLDAFLTLWLSQPLFAGLGEQAAVFAARRTNRSEAMAESLRSVGTGHQANLWPDLSDILCPTLVVTGANDEKFTLLGRELRRSIGKRAELVTVNDSGHSVHLEHPNETWAVVHEWLNRVQPDGNQ